MAARGRKPISVGEKRLTGNPGRRKLEPVLPEAPKGALECPLAVAADPAARAYWDHFVHTAPPGVLRPVHAPQLADLAIACVLYDQALLELRQGGGLVVLAPVTGAPVQNPYLAILNRQAEMKRKLCSSLCLSPAEQNRVAPRDRPGDGAAKPDEWGF